MCETPAKYQPSLNEARWPDFQKKVVKHHELCRHRDDIIFLGIVETLCGGRSYFLRIAGSATLRARLVFCFCDRFLNDLMVRGRQLRRAELDSQLVELAREAEGTW